VKPEISFSGVIRNEGRRALTPMSWYIGFPCRGCGRHFAIMDDPTDSGEIALSGDARFHAVCPNCGVGADYAASDLEPFQAAQGGSVSTA